MQATATVADIKAVIIVAPIFAINTMAGHVIVTVANHLTVRCAGVLLFQIFLVLGLAFSLFLLFFYCFIIIGSIVSVVVYVVLEEIVVRSC